MSPGEALCGTAAEREAYRRTLADFILSREAQIRAIARRKLTVSTRSVFDSEDVLSSVLRRLDSLVQRGKLRPGCEAELWGFIKVIASNNAVSKSRLIECSRKWLTDEPEYAYYIVKVINACEDDDEVSWLVYRMAGSLAGEDRQIFFLRVRGAMHQAVARVLGIDEGAVRQRWSRICRELRDRFGGDQP